MLTMHAVRRASLESLGSEIKRGALALKNCVCALTTRMIPKME
jgi:hypothetical protein